MTTDPENFDIDEYFKSEAAKRREGGDFNQLIDDLRKQLYILTMARGAKRAGLEMQTERRIKELIRQWVDLNPECICVQGSPEDYEGPMRDCPIHGESSDS